MIAGRPRRPGGSLTCAGWPASSTARGVESRALVAMTDALAHRGPDGEGYAALGDEPRARVLVTARRSPRVPARIRAGLGHRRLTIIDPTDDSAQPMRDAVRALRPRLQRRALQLRRAALRAGTRRPDVLHRGRHRGGAAGLGALGSGVPGALRRHVGVRDPRRGAPAARALPRPLRHQAALLHARRRRRCASRRRSRACSRRWTTPEADESVVAGFLLSGADTGPETFFQGIRRLPAAHLLEVPLDDPRARRRGATGSSPTRSTPTATTRRPGSPSCSGTASGSTPAATSPVGTCLSGGLDSSSIVCTASALKADGLLPASYRHQAFGYVPPDEAVSERRWMDMVVERTGVALEEVRPAPERFDGVAGDDRAPAGRAVRVDQHRGAVVRVRGGARGRDEGHARRPGRRRGARRLPRLSGDDRRRHAQRAPAARVRAAGARSSAPARRVAAAGRDGDRDAARLRSGSVAGRLRSSDGRDRPPAAGQRARRAAASAACPPAPPLPTDLQALLRHQVQTSLPSLLRYEDRNSMAHSIEARVPFLDHRLVELAFRLPAARARCGAPTRSGVLREAMKGVLPEPIRTRRDKLGFRADPRSGGTLRARASRRAGGQRDRGREPVVRRGRGARVHRRRPDGSGARLPAVADHQRQAVGARPLARMRGARICAWPTASEGYVARRPAADAALHAPVTLLDGTRETRGRLVLDTAHRQLHAVRDRQGVRGLPRVAVRGSTRCSVSSPASGATMPERTMLDYGCGPGDDLTGLALYSGAAQLIGLDVSATALGLTSRRLALHGVAPRPHHAPPGRRLHAGDPAGGSRPSTT